MMKIENDCCGCTSVGLPCLGSCTKRHTKHYYCDECGSEEDVYRFDDKDLCLECITEKLEKAEYFYMD